MPSIHTLKTFLVAARCGTFAATSEQISLTPAAVGLRIKALEEDLRCELFVRTGRSIELSPQGRSLVAKIEAIIEAYDSLIYVDEPDELSGAVSVGALISSLMGAFSDALRAIKEKHPKLHITLYAGLSSDFAEKVRCGELDAAVVTRSPSPLSAELVWTPLYVEPMIAIVPKSTNGPADHLRDPRDALSTLPFLRFQQQTWTGLLVQEALHHLNFFPNEEMELNSIETIIELVRQGFGGSIVPRLANIDWDHDERLRVMPLPHVPVSRRVGLLERRGHQRSNFTREIKAYFLGAAPGHPPVGTQGGGAG